MILAAALFLFLPQTAFAQDLDPCAGGSEGIACVTSNLEFGGVLGGLINFIFVIAVVLALVYLIWGGIIWLTSGGDKEGVAGARNRIIAAIIGLILIFLSYVILNLVLVFLGYQDGIAGIEITPITNEAGTPNSQRCPIASRPTCDNPICGPSGWTCQNP